ncbi:polysaccharide deacetylase family protein [Candidatus Poribacteria bacterium]|nr:polysaccharide deacetylase family protein [Candidatus Poribacteria bacterium]
MPIKLGNFIKNAISAVVLLFGIPFLIREWFCKNKVAVLLYHDVQPDIFAKHIDYLSRHYNIISLDLLVTSVHNKDFSDIPPKSVVITVDDGHAGNIALLSIIMQYDIFPTIYVCTQIINTHRHFWFRIPILSKKEKEHLKRLPNAERLRHLRQTSNYKPEKEYEDRQALSLNEMKQMMHYVDFQPHTQFHPILPNCTKTECNQEIRDSKVDLEGLLDIKCYHFSYPNGDYTEREIEFVKAAGYRSARTVDIGWNRNNTSPYKLRAIPISDDAGLIRFRAELTGIPQRIGKWVNSLLWRITI